MGRQEAKFHIVVLTISTVLFSQGTCTLCPRQCFRLVTKHILTLMCIVSGAYEVASGRGATSAGVGEGCCGQISLQAFEGSSSRWHSPVCTLKLNWGLDCSLSGCCSPGCREPWEAEQHSGQSTASRAQLPGSEANYRCWEHNISPLVLYSPIYRMKTY